MKTTKWFWKIRVPRWMVARVSFRFENRWKWGGECGQFIIWLGTELSHNGDYNHIQGAHSFDLTICNFGFKVDIVPHRPEPPYGIHRNMIKKAAGQKYDEELEAPDEDKDFANSLTIL